MRRLRHSTKIQCFLALVFFNVFLLSGSARSEELPDASESHPGLGQESKFAEAIVAYNKRQTKKSLKILDELLVTAPDNHEYLEMKALLLKGEGDPQKSFEVYERLYQTTAEKDRGPYAFELASILFQEKKIAEAKKYFEKSIALNFNVVASHFFLGLGAYQQNNFSDAANHFVYAADSDIDPFTVTGKYYLGICYFKLNNGPQGVQELFDVRGMTKNAKPGDMTKNIADGTEKMLHPFSTGQWFANLMLQSQYDSNAQQLPAAFSNPTGGTNPATMKMNFSGGAGYMSAPLDTIQWVAGYQASYNYNFNRDTKGFEYFTNNASLYANYNTLARTSGGLKVESSFAFQNSPSDPLDPQGSFEYQKYNYTLGVSPYFRHQISRELKLEIEAGLRKQTFYSDPNLSGMDYNARVSIRNDIGREYFNPGVSLFYDNDRTDGDQFYYHAYGLGLMNSMGFSGAITFSQSLDVLFTKYSKTDPARNDTNYAFKLSAVKLLNPKFSVLVDAGYIKNNSSISEVYSYNQFISSLGVGYTF